MPRRVQPSKRPEIRLDATLPVPLYKQLYERLRGAILIGQLERGGYSYWTWWINRFPSANPLRAGFFVKV
jgi:hypothetical protein